MTIENAEVFGLSDSVRASKFPMSINTEICNFDITDTVNRLASCDIGAGHDNFLNGIIVQFDLTFTVKAWTELERYHFIDFVSSQSTMHRIAKFDIDEQYISFVDDRIIAVMHELINEYNNIPDDDERKKTAYLRCLYSNPCGFQLTARMTTNYRQLKTIYKQRKNHRLPEWREFCEWIKNLPNSEWIIGEEQ